MLARVFGIIAFFFIFPVGLYSQGYVITLKHWGVEDGLSHRQVNNVYQDSKGFIWLCTVNGVDRFDGYNFTWYSREKDHLPFANIDAITEDSSGQMWCTSSVSDTKNFFLFNPYSGSHTCFDSMKIPFPVAKAYAVYTLRDGTILLQTMDNTWLLWNTKSGYRRITMPAGSTMGRYWPDQEAFLTRSDKGRLQLISPYGAVLATGDSLKWPLHYYYYSNVQANGDYLYTDDGQWAYVSRGLKIIYNPDLPEPDKGYIDYAVDLGIDSIVLRQSMLYKRGQGVLKDFKKGEEGKGLQAIRSVIKDRFFPGRYWIATEFGLYMLTIAPQKFHRYLTDSATNLMSGNSYRGLLADSGVLYGCKESWGVVRLGLNDNKLSAVVPLKASVPQYFGIIKLRDGNIEASLGARLATFQPGGKIISYHYLTGHIFIGCWCMYEYMPQRLLLGVFGGLRKANLATGEDESFTDYNRFPELGNSLVIAISPDRSGQLWMCCDKGFYMVDTLHGITARYSSDDTGSHYLPSRAFQHFYQDADGIYWLATADGLIRWDKAHGKYKMYTRSDGLSNDDIYAVFEDGAGRLWLSSDYGIMEMEKASGIVKTYLQQDGLSNNEFNRLSYYQDKDGTIYFGSLNGITAFNPKDFPNGGNSDSRAMLVTTVFQQFNGETNRLENRTYELLKTNTIVMKPDDRFFNIEFSLLSFTDPEHNLYYWKIDQIDTNWNIQKDRNIRLGHLPYGDYLLHIKAQASDGGWSRNELAIRINVVRPLYLRAWFLILCAVVMILLAIAGYRWRIYLLEQENKRLDTVVRNKTEDLQISLHEKEILLKEIHHRVKNNLQIISSLLRLQAGSVADEAAKAALIESQNRVLSIALIHQKLYQDRQIDKVEFSTFADELFSQLNSVFGAGAKVTFINNVPEIFLNIDTAIPLGLILNELTTNSFKYAFKAVSAPAITLGLEYSGDGYFLVYYDNGPGLPEGMNIERVKSLGLRLVGRLSKQLQGNVKYAKNNLSSCFSISFKEKNVL